MVSILVVVERLARAQLHPAIDTVVLEQVGKVDAFHVIPHVAAALTLLSADLAGKAGSYANAYVGVGGARTLQHVGVQKTGTPLRCGFTL